MSRKVEEKQSVDSAPADYSHAFAGLLNASCGLCWTAAYILYVQQAGQDHSYGMPLGALVLNLSWEFVYTFLWPVHGAARFFYFPWLFLDALLLSQTIKHGPRMWQNSSPIVAQNFNAIVGICSFLALTAQWSFAHQFANSNPSFWSAYVCQNILSWGSLWMLLTRGHGGGHSMAIWWFRFIGSLSASLRYLYRLYNWPSKYGFVGASFSSWILWMPCIADLLYPAIYNMVTKSQPNDDGIYS